MSQNRWRGSGNGYFFWARLGESTCGRGGNDKGIKVLSEVKRIELLVGEARFLNTHEKIGFPIKKYHKMAKCVLGIGAPTKEEYCGLSPYVLIKFSDFLNFLIVRLVSLALPHRFGTGFLHLT